MAALKKNNRQEIPFILDGKTITKIVHKNTTCSDVISKLPNLQIPLAVFESIDGVEKELRAKTKLLKVWRANGSTSNVAFVIKRSQKLSKTKKSERKLASDATNGKQEKTLSKDTLKQVSDLAFYVRYQKTKLQALKQNPDIYSTPSKPIRLRRLTSNASVNSMDAFLAKADLNEMANLLTFCGEVAAEKLGKGKQKKESGEFYEEPVTDRNQTIGSSKPDSEQKKLVTHECIKSTKLGFKENFIQKKPLQRTTSTGTINSTDTGYSSIDSECERLSKTPASSVNESKYHFPMLTNIRDVPRHSTPITAVRTLKRRADELDSTFDANKTLIFDNFQQMNEIQGKSMILQKFMADQTLGPYAERNGLDEFNSPDVNRRCTEQYRIPAFDTQEDVCRFLWNKNCDSDSECESDISEPCESLDLAFNSGNINNINSLRSPPRTLRRESAISNLNRLYFKVNTEETLKTLRRESAISNLNQFSLLSRDIGLDSFDDSNGFDYSFDCSFPRMDETKSEDFSMDFSYDYDESDSENESYCNEDDCMDSFMKTRSFINISGDVTANDATDQLINFDEDLVSTCSGSMIDCSELEMMI